MESPAGGLVLHCSSLLSCTLRVCPPLSVSKGPWFPFHCGPRDMPHCLKYCKWDMDPQSPKKGGWEKNKRIIGLN